MMDSDIIQENFCNQEVFNSSIEYAEPISIIRIITSILSVIGATSIIIGVFLTGKLSNSEVHPLFTLSVGDFILSCTWIFGGAVWLHGKSYNDAGGGGLGLCYVLAVATSILSLTTYLLTVVYGAHALMRMKELYQNRGRQSLESNNKSCWQYLLTALMYIICWGLPATLVIPVTESQVGLNISNKACWCFVDFFNTRPDNGNDTAASEFDQLAVILASFNGTFFAVSTVIIITMYTFTIYLAWKVIQLQKYQQVDQRFTKIIRRLTARALVFISIFFICGLPAFLGSILVWNEKRTLTVLETPDKVILFFQALLAPLQGFLNALFYGWSRKEFRQAIKVHVRVRMKFTKGENNTSESDHTGLINFRGTSSYSDS